MSRKPAAKPPAKSAVQRQPEPTTPYPSLRSAMWLYLGALLGATAIILPLAPAIRDSLLLNLIALLVTCLGFTIAAMFITDVHVTAIFGTRSRIPNIILCLLVGLALLVPARWLLYVLYGYMTTSIGPLTINPPQPSSAEPWSVLLQSALVFPLVEGLLFFAYFQRGAEGLSQIRGAVLTGVLYAIYSLLFSVVSGFSAFPGLLLVGLAAAFAVYFTGSAWSGIAVAAGHGAAQTLLERPLFDFLGPQWVDVFSARWLLITVISAFIAFILIQVIRVRATPSNTPRARPKALWWIPLVISVVFLLVVVSSEISLRLVNQQRSSISNTPRPAVPAVAPPQPSTSVPAPSQAP